MRVSKGTRGMPSPPCRKYTQGCRTSSFDMIAKNEYIIKNRNTLQKQQLLDFCQFSQMSKQITCSCIVSLSSHAFGSLFKVQCHTFCPHVHNCNLSLCFDNQLICICQYGCTPKNSKRSSLPPSAFRNPKSNNCWTFPFDFNIKKVPCKLDLTISKCAHDIEQHFTS